MSRVIISSILFLFFCCTLIDSAKLRTYEVARDYYVAAVVEYEGGKDTQHLTANEILWKNAEHFRNITSGAAAQGADIVVFAEYGLTSMGTSPPQVQLIGEKGDNPCNVSSGISSEVIRYISCAARESQIYVVIDILELVPAGIQGAERSYIYNSAVAFDREGTIVAKYHKTNLAAGEVIPLDAPEVPEIISFTTDFGVEFGMLICFDILFEQPAKSLLERGVRHFVFPTAWIDELPYLTALQSQTFWASSASSFLLASGFHRPDHGNLGSGVFSPTGQPINYTFDIKSGTKIIYAEVPKNPEDTLSRANKFTNRLGYQKDNNQVNDRFYYREELDNFTVSPGLGISLNEEKIQVCEDGLCCSLKYSYINDVAASGSVQHRLVAFNKERSFPAPVVKNMRLQICSVVRCLNDTLASCNFNAHDSLDSSLRFSSFELEATGLNTLEYFQPGFTTLDVNMDLIPFDMFGRELSKDGHTWTLKSNLLRTVDIQTVAMYHRAA